MNPELSRRVAKVINYIIENNLIDCSQLEFANKVENVNNFEDLDEKDQKIVMEAEKKLNNINESKHNAFEHKLNSNECHNPSGQTNGGQFCSKDDPDNDISNSIYSDQISKNIENLRNQYPGVINSIKTIKLGSTTGYAESSRKNKSIILNKYFFGTKNGNDDMKADMKKAVESGYHPKGCDTIKSILDHEIGHQIYNMWIMRNHDKKPSQIKTTKTEDELNILLWGDLKNNPPSEYAKLNNEELFAEAFSSYRNTPIEEQSEPVKQFGKLLSSKFFKQLGDQ